MLIIKSIIKKNEFMKTNEMYETPLVEVIEVEVEKGFASTTSENENTPDWPEYEI